ncbi:glycoside hydrolase family 3 protein [Amanita thiersii Skay4041]|uniref:beta-glucosidase n=1 Tax=Amanita thiersii Skay4041 TaxID=703135 RepID=A0A2A9N7D9_9AGAR|nr:glycoside hydrolase family 3 protein [Amanita thiersii Skay4041]
MHSLPLLVALFQPTVLAATALTSAPGGITVTVPASSAASSVSFSTATGSQAATVSSSQASLTTLSISSAASSASSTLSILQSLPGNTTASQTGFIPFPTPSTESIPGVFPASDPHDPPPAGSSVIPNFGPAWSAAYKKAKQKIAGFSLEEKISTATGVGWMGGRCVGNIAPIEPIRGRGWPGLCLEDSPLGVRFGDFVTAFPTAVNTAATFKRSLMRMRGLFMGQEHVGKGVNVALGPMMNLGRVAQGGRNWEGFGADPFLAGEGAYETILGMQQAGVQACAKHLINNEQENKREESTSEVDDRTQHEIYAHPFMKSIMAGVASIMCSYNQVNGTYACENDKVLNDIVKREYGFQGYIMSDWGATHSTESAVAGLDMTMPGGTRFDSFDSYFGGNLTEYVRNGTIAEGRVDDMATRILAAWYLVHQDAPSYPTTNFDAFKPNNEATNEHVDVQADHYKLVREIGSASTVLLKNEKGALPLKNPRSIILLGNDAGPGMAGPNEFSDQGGDDGVLAMGWGSGTANFPYLISPLEGIQRRARENGGHTLVSWSFNDFDLRRARTDSAFKSAAIVFINSDSGEAYINVDGNQGDRKNLTAWHGGDDLVLAVASVNPNTIVVTHSVGPLIIEPWIDHPNVTAVLWAGVPGQEAGNSIADVLFGDVNPSGRLPYTIAKQVSDYGAQLITAQPAGILPIPYDDGLEIDYRHFDAKGIEPRFEFGFGLSYTKFSYSQARVTKVHTIGNTQADLIAAWEAGKPSPIGEGSTTAIWLHRPAYQVTFNVKNTGSVAGTEIPQVYINMPASSGEPPSLLRGFSDVDLNPGQSKTVTITLSRYDLSIWDSGAQGWRRPDGKIGVTIGASSRDGRLTSAIPT